MDTTIKQIKKCLFEEAEALNTLAELVDKSYLDVLNLISNCSGKCCFTGVGKSFIVASKIASSFCSLGICSIAIDPLRLLHGDLGSLSKDDIVFALSNSGETEILLQAIKLVAGMKIKIISMTGSSNSSLAQLSNCHLLVETKEAGPFGLVPSTSTTAMMAIGDALLCGLVEKEKITIERFKEFHPGGTLGKKMQEIQ
jgi:arabinose-5-phosphate isomerase